MSRGTLAVDRMDTPKLWDALELRLLSIQREPVTLNDVRRRRWMMVEAYEIGRELRMRGAQLSLAGPVLR